MAKERAAIRGFLRVNIEDGPTGKIVGDSGWIENQIVNEGYDDFLCRLLANTQSSKQIRYMGLGTGTDPNATHTTLNGEIGSAIRKAVAVSVESSKTVHFRATFYSSDSFLGGTSNIRNLGLFDTNDSDGVIFAGKSFASSVCDTNQNVNCSYAIQFS